MPSSNGSAFFVVEGMCLDMEKLEVEPDTHFRRAVTDVPCNLGRPDVKRPSSGSDGPAKLDLQGADKHVSRKHVRIEWEPMSGLYQAVVLGKADIVVDGEPAMLRAACSHGGRRADQRFECPFARARRQDVLQRLGGYGGYRAPAFGIGAAGWQRALLLPPAKGAHGRVPAVPAPQRAEGPPRASRKRGSSCA